MEDGRMMELLDHSGNGPPQESTQSDGLNNRAASD